MSTATVTINDVMLQYKRVAKGLSSQAISDVKQTGPATVRAVQAGAGTTGVAATVGSLKVLDGVSALATKYVEGCDSFVSACDRRKVAMAKHVLGKYGHLLDKQ